MKKLITACAVLALLAGLSPVFGGQVVSGTFDGQTANPIYIGVGFVPDWVKVVNAEAAAAASISWSVNNRAVEQLAGTVNAGAAGTNSVRTIGTGIAVYRGGDVLTAAAATNYLVRDSADYRGSGTGADVTYWTLDTNSTRYGHFDATPSTTYVGEGSRINIEGKWYTIMAMAADATVKGSVLLDEAAASGNVNALRPMFDYKLASEGTVMPAGFSIANTEVNVSGNICYFEAGVYDEK